MKKKKQIIIANWKMSPEMLSEAKKLFLGTKKTASTLSRVQTIFCPPFLYLSELTKLYKGHRIHFGAQDLFYKETGPYTGEISAEMLLNAGATCVIVGHSERRALGEDNETVNKKLRAALTHKLSGILCIGEEERDIQGEYLKFLQVQLVDGLKGVSSSELRSIVIVYEPIWAIGKSAAEAMHPDELHQMVIFVRKTLSELYDKKVAMAVPVLYGGSVEPANTMLLFERGEINGLLVGHASLDPEAFGEILRLANQTMH